MKSCYHCDSDIESNNQKCRNSEFAYCESAHQIPMHDESKKSIKPEGWKIIGELKGYHRDGVDSISSLVPEFEQDEVERVAKAIYLNMFPERTVIDWHEERTFDNGRLYHAYIGCAKQAIIAMKIPEPVSSWQPIETAPKDGTEILVFSPEREEGRGISVVFWKNSAWAFLEIGESQLNITDKLTHWQSIPCSPKQEQGND